jgi:hypothetical protein
MSRNNLSSLDVTNLPNLQLIDLYQNNFTSLDNILGLTSNITKLMLGKNNFTSVNLSSFTGLTDLDLSDSDLSDIDLTGLVNLQYLYLDYNFGIKDIYGISDLTSLKYLSVVYTNNPSLDLTGLINLQEVYAGGVSFSPTNTDLLINTLNNSTTFTGGTFSASIQARTSNSLTSYNDLINNKFWNVGEDIYPDLGSLTFVTSKGPGDTIQGYIGASSTKVKIVYWDGTEELINSSDFFTKTIDINDTYSVRVVEVFSWDAEYDREYGSLSFVTIDECYPTGVSVINQKTLQSLSLNNGNTNNGTQLTPQLNDQVLSELSQNYYEGGQFYTYNGRTSTSTSNYNTLINRNWQIFGADLISTGGRRVGIRRRNP